MRYELRGCAEAGPFDFTWWGPVSGKEHFERTWECTVEIDRQSLRIRHGIGRRHAYGRDRVHSVTWIRDEPIVEGVEADDYLESRALISSIKRSDRKLARSAEEVPEGYQRFQLVSHRQEIDAPYSRHGLAVKIRENDVESWVALAVLRSDHPGRLQSSLPRRPPNRTALERQPERVRAFEPFDPVVKAAVAQELIRFEEHRNVPIRRGIVKLTEDPEADRLVHEDGFAFLLGVLFDQQVRYGTA